MNAALMFIMCLCVGVMWGAKVCKVHSGNGKNIGSCDTYAYMDINKNRTPSHILIETCDPITQIREYNMGINETPCRCCGPNHEYACTQRRTTIPVTYKNKTTCNMTFNSGCDCVKDENVNCKEGVNKTVPAVSESGCS